MECTNSILQCGSELSLCHVKKNGTLRAILFSKFKLHVQKKSQDSSTLLEGLGTWLALSPHPHPRHSRGIPADELTADLDMEQDTNEEQKVG